MFNRYDNIDDTVRLQSTSYKKQLSYIYHRGARLRVIVIDILYYIAFWLILLKHVYRVTNIHVNEDLLYLEPWFAHYQMASIVKKYILGSFLLICINNLLLFY